MTFSFHPDGAAEFLEAVDYYERGESGLGLDFSLEVNAAIENIIRHPAAWPKLEGSVRRCLTNRFPYGVLYCVDPAEIHILAVMHLHRDPDYWKHRQ